jgi:hypothetical protein
VPNTPVIVNGLVTVFELAAIQIVKVLNNVPGYAQLLSNNTCTGTIFRLRLNLHRDTAPMPIYKFLYRDKYSSTSLTCTATRLQLKKICTMTPKTAPYLPSAFYREHYPLSSCLGDSRQVTPTNYTAGPLAFMLSDD